MDIVAYLSKLGYEPSKIRGNDHWYYSPFRNENSPSFKVNRRKNRWYDFGEGKGGSLIDFGIRYNNCTIGEFLALIVNDELPVSTIIHSSNAKEKEAPKIDILKVKELASQALLAYIASRRIPFSIAKQFLKEVTYTNAGKTFFALGFQTDAGGYELRSAYFKGSSAPKFYTHIKNSFDTLCVFEGFMDFLSFITILQASAMPAHYDFLILNSLSFVTVSIEKMKSYPAVDLYLDNNQPGDKFTAEIKSVIPGAEDKRSFFKNYEDMNAFLCRPSYRTKFK
ncbi:DNA primase [Sphingobacterium sp. PM2-P1-29]|nr:DNA primase [Sphingobacterium sp. PM2-P1-29]